MNKLKRYEPVECGEGVAEMVESRNGECYFATDVDKRSAELKTALHDAWALIANAYDYARWHGETRANKSGTNQWKAAADKFRDEVYHPLMRDSQETEPV